MRGDEGENNGGFFSPHGEAAAEVCSNNKKAEVNRIGCILKEQKTKAATAASHTPLVTVFLRLNDIFEELEAEERELRKMYKISSISNMSRETAVQNAAGFPGCSGLWSTSVRTSPVSLSGFSFLHSSML